MTKTNCFSVNELTDSVLVAGLRKELEASQQMVAALKSQLSALRIDHEMALVSLNRANNKNTQLECVIKYGHQPWPCWVLGIRYFCERTKTPLVPAVQI